MAQWQDETQRFNRRFIESTSRSLRRSERWMDIDIPPIDVEDFMRSTREQIERSIRGNFDFGSFTLNGVEFELSPEPPQIQELEVNTQQTNNGEKINSQFADFLFAALFSDKTRTEIEGMVYDITAKHLKESAPIEVMITVPDMGQYQAAGITHPKFEDAMRAALTIKNLMLVGPAGCGKTHLAHQVAEALKRDFASISCTAGMSESHLQGWLLPNEAGTFEYHTSDFVRLYESGGVFLLDEMDGADPNILLIINQALANGGFHLPQRKDNTFVKRHADFVCVAACNTFGTGANTTYAGRERLDESTIDRFRAGIIALDYNEHLEKSIVDPEILGWGKHVRERIKSTQLRRVMSTRFLIDATKLKRSGATLKHIRDTYFLGWKEDEREKVAQR
jgi:cobaltochelatase CobS